MTHQCRGKRAWRYAYEAEQALRKIRAYVKTDPTARGGKVPTRVYRCPVCRQHHLTSQGTEQSVVLSIKPPKAVIPDPPKVSRSSPLTNVKTRSRTEL